MQGSLTRRRRLRAPVAAGAVALSFGTAFAFGHTGGGVPESEPVRGATLTVARDLPAIPALAVSGAPPALAKPVRRVHSRKRHVDDAPQRHRVVEQALPVATDPSAPRPAAGPAPSRGGRRSGGGARSTGGERGGGSTGDGAASPVVTPAPVQVAPAPVEVAPEEESDEDAPPEEEE